MINVNDMSKEQLWKLREEIVLGSLFMGDFENSYDIDPKAVQDFFDAFVEDCILQMTEKGMSADDAYDAFTETGDWDNAEKLYDYYLSVEYPFGDFEVEKIEEANKTKAQRHNDMMDTIFDNAKKQNQILKDILKDNGISEEEIEELDKATGLHGNALHKKVYDLGLNDEFVKRLGLKEALDQFSDTAHSEILNADIKINPNRHSADDKMFCGTYFIGTYVDGDLAGHEYVFVLADSEGHRFMNEYMGYPVDENGYVDQPTDVIVRDGKDEVYFMVEPKELFKEKVEESIIMNESVGDPDFELIEDKLLDIPYTSKVEFDYRPYDDVYKKPQDHFIVLVFNNDNFGHGSDYIINSIRWKKNVINTLKELGWKLEDPLEDNGSYLYLVMEKDTSAIIDESVETDNLEYVSAIDAATHVLVDGGKITILGHNGMLGSDFYLDGDTLTAYNFEVGKCNVNIDLAKHLANLESQGFKFIISDNIKDTKAYHVNNTYIEEAINKKANNAKAFVIKTETEAKTEGYDITSSILPDSEVVGHVEVYSDYETAKSRALMLGLKEAEYGDEFGSDISYCAWNKSGDRNEEAEVLAYYKFENGKPVALTDEEKATVENVKELTFDDIAGPIKEKLILKESSLQKGEHKISDTEILTWGWEKGYNGGSYYVEKIYLPSPNSDMWSTEFHKTYATEEAARRAFNRYKKQYSLTEDANTNKQTTVQKFNNRMAELCKEKGYLGEAEIKAEMQKYLNKVDTSKIYQSNFVYDFIDEMVARNGTNISGEDRDDLEDYYLNIVYSDDDFCTKLDACIIDESWTYSPEEFGLTDEDIKALPIIYGYIAHSDMTDITHIVFSKDRKNLVGIEAKFDELLDAAGDSEYEDVTQNIINDLENKGVYIINSEGPFGGREINQYELDDGALVWVLTDNNEGKDYKIEEVGYDSWRF